MRTSILKLATGAAVGASMAFSPMLASANAILLATPENFDGRSQTSRLFLFGEANVTGAVSSMAGGFNMPFDLGPTGVTDIALPTANLITANSTIENKGFLIESPDPISAHWLSRASFTTDMTFLHDANSLSTDYYVMSIGGGFGQGSQFTLTAREDNTTVTITPSANLSTGQAANVPFNVTLNAGETVKYSANPGPDLTGSRVQADKAVALFGGHSCAQVPPGTTACDFLISQLPGVDNYATDFVVPEVGSNGAAGNLIRILASEDNTSVSVDGIVVATLNAGEFHEIDFFQGGVINADKPVLVGQYLKGVGQTGNGDPAFTFVPGTNQLLDEYVFSTPVGADTFALDTLTIAAPTVDLASLLFDGAPLGIGFTPLGSSGFSVGELTLTDGIHNIQGNSGFLPLIAGFQSADSYLTIIGSTFTPGASPPPPPPPPMGVTEPVALTGMAAGLLGIAWLRRRNC